MADSVEETEQGDSTEAEEDRAEAPEPRFRLTTGQLLAGIFGLGLALRLLHFWAIAITAFPRIPLVFTEADMHVYWQWAQTILDGDLLGRNTYHPYLEWMKPIAPLETWYGWWGGKQIFRHAPLYPYWVAGVLTLSGPGANLWFVLLVQLLVGALEPLVVFSLARRLFDARTGLAAAALAALYGPLIFYQGALLRDWLPPLVEPTVLLALLGARAGGRHRQWLLAGAAVGLSLLVKETILVFVPLALLWLGFEYRWAIRRMAAPTTLALLGFLLVLSPLVLRNALVGAPLFAVSNRAATEAFIGGNAADGAPINLDHPPSLKGIMERSGGRTLAVVRETLATYQGDWRRFARFELTKLRGLLSPLEVPNNLSFYYGLDISPPLRFTLGWGVLFPLGLAGFLLSLRAPSRHRLLALYALSAAVGLLIFAIVDRFRLILVPVLSVYGAFGVVWLVDAVRGRRMLPAVGYLGLIVALVGLQHLPALVLPEDPVMLRSQEYVFSAQVYAAEGRIDRAVAEMARLRAKVRQRPGLTAVAAEASYQDAWFHVLWARQLLMTGNRQAARREADRAAEAYASHRHLSEPFNNLGLLYLMLDDRATAKSYFRQFLEIEPQGAAADSIRRILSRLESSP